MSDSDDPKREYCFSIIFNQNEALGIAFDEDGRIEMNWNTNQGEPIRIEAVPRDSDITIPVVTIRSGQPPSTDGTVH